MVTGEFWTYSLGSKFLCDVYSGVVAVGTVRLFWWCSLTRGEEKIEVEKEQYFNIYLLMSIKWLQWKILYTQECGQRFIAQHTENNICFINAISDYFGSIQSNEKRVTCCNSKCHMVYIRGVLWLLTHNQQLVLCQYFSTELYLFIIAICKQSLVHLSLLGLMQLQLRESEINKVLDGMCQLDNESDLEAKTLITFGEITLIE